ncbi:MAG: hypothetical protein S4CHLAM37_16650 [Chlamydiia bacterium]|nr:hypothetical protein [Chlamydiia bacterium]
MAVMVAAAENYEQFFEEFDGFNPVQGGRYQRECSSSGFPRHKGLTTDRHLIPDPKSGELPLRIWTQTVISKRVGELFKTANGFRTHLMAIQSELNRLKKRNLENMNGEEVTLAYAASKEIRKAVIEAAKGAKVSLPADLNPEASTLHFPLLENSDLFIHKIMNQARKV